jgi:nucleotide-binding universal stress UspA family protein
VHSPFRKLLVVLDLTAPQQAAVAAAARVAREGPTRVELYDCGAREPLPLSWAGGTDVLQEYRALLQERSLADLERLARPLRAGGIDVTTYAEEGGPLEDAIARHLAQAAPDLIFKDRAGASADAGSWPVRTDGILRRHATCPVVLVGDEPQADNGLQAPPRTTKEVA